MTTPPLDEVETDDLIYVDVTTYTGEELMAEQERCQEVIDLNVMAGHHDLTTWYDRINHIETMHALKRTLSAHSVWDTHE